VIGVVSDLLRCPRCGTELEPAGRSLRCRAGHAFDVARQGYVNLTQAAQPGHADTATMVAARDALLGSGRYDVVIEAVLSMVPSGSTDLLDVGTGTGHYPAAVLDSLPAARCLGLDVSVAACRRAARAHPRLGVATADAWGQLPVADAAVDAVLSVFAPRNPVELARVLRPDGSVITVTPEPAHLIELRGALGLLGVEADKQSRLAQSLSRPGFRALEHQQVDEHQRWELEDAVHAVLMGPNAFHHTEVEIRDRAARLDWPRTVTIAARVTRWGR